MSLRIIQSLLSIIQIFKPFWQENSLVSLAARLSIQISPIFPDSRLKMLFNVQFAVLLALCSSAYASPLVARDGTDLEARMAKKKPMVDVDCGGTKFTSDQIAASKTQAQAGQFGKYPEKYGNSDKVFGATSQLWSFPLMDPVYRSTCTIHLLYFPHDPIRQTSKEKGKLTCILFTSRRTWKVSRRHG